MNTRGHNEGIEVSSKGKTSDFGSENRGSIPLTSTKLLGWLWTQLGQFSS